MIYQGKAICVDIDNDNIARLHFDLEGASVNKFNRLAVGELSEAITALENTPGVAGLLITSGKSVFIAGADIEELAQLNQTIDGPGAEDFLQLNNVNFNRLEDLPFPTVAVINGFALGGGFELCLACDCRVISETAAVGLPEVQLGLIPGWGGTVRLPRLIGLANAIDWVTSGSHQKASAALDAGAVNAVVAAEQLEQQAREWLQQCCDGTVDYQTSRRKKQSPITDVAAEAVTAAKARFAKLGNPAPLTAVTVMENAAAMTREQALQEEGNAFAELLGSDSAAAMIGTFLSDQQLAKKAKLLAKQASRPVTKAAVLGAGIMGGGISYQSALKGIPTLMKDIRQEGIDLGLAEADKLLEKRVKRGSMGPEQKAQVLERIHPTLDYSDFDDVDLVVEAVLENPKVKHAVLAEVEQQLPEHAVITSNTSTISISLLAQALQRPENFCGMHFFNPVHAMPLVEVIRGDQTGDEAVARTVAYAASLGKKPIVVNDCPGFLVNRALFPYLAGFTGLLRDGADFVDIDRVMTAWGWPMGPALLSDVIGIDTIVHCEEVMAEGFPDRMTKTQPLAMDLLFQAERFGQKNGKGFYDHSRGENGRPVQTPAAETYRLLGEHSAPRCTFSDGEIIARTMVPMANELARILDEGIVSSPAEADLGLLYGLGFPAFRGGVLRWLDAMGLPAFCEMAEAFSALGKLYEPTDSIRQMVADKRRFYS